MKKFTASEIVRAALHWGEESITAMIDAHRPQFGELDTKDEYIAYLLNLRRQMSAYSRKRFGKRPDPLEGAVLVDAMTMKRNTKLQFPE